MKKSLSKEGTAAERRRKAMIEAAYTLFVEKGYGSVSVDEIIKHSKGSKSTLYKFFGSKEGIMKAVVESLAAEMLRHITIEYPPGKNVRNVLIHIGEVLVDLALSDNAINQHRLAVSNANTFPDVAKLWYESGPKTTFDGIAEVLARENSKGRLKVENPLHAAWFFGGMLIFKENMTRLIGAPQAKKAEKKALVQEAVDGFLKIYSP
jgi:TetR/AcrR family transcriptional repressor of mexJK operon